MIAVFDASRPRTFVRQTPTRAGFALDAGFVGEPDVEVRVALELGHLGAKRFAQRFVLAVEAELRDFEDEAFFVKKSQQSLAGAFDLALGGDVAAKGLGGGDGLGTVFWGLEILDDGLGFRGGDFARREPSARASRP